MKTVISISFLSFALLVFACNNGKSPQPENIHTPIKVESVDNYLANTSYLTGRKQGDNGKPPIEIWNPTIRQTAHCIL